MVAFAGNVKGSPNFGTTGNGDRCCSFELGSSFLGKSSRKTTWVRINAYGDLVDRIEARIQKGSYVVVDGQLVNRRGRSGELVEIRARDVVIHNKAEGERE